jgi:hypothetical protein
MAYDFQPGEGIPLSYNSYQAVFPTPPRRVPGSALGSNSRVWFPCSIPIAADLAAPIGERSLHTGEVIGSISTAPTSIIKHLAE